MKKIWLYQVIISGFVGFDLVGIWTHGPHIRAVLSQIPVLSPYAPYLSVPVVLGIGFVAVFEPALDIYLAKYLWKKIRTRKVIS